MGFSIKMKGKIMAAGVSLLLLSGMGGCSNNDLSNTVYASFYSLSYFVKKVAGDKLEVRTLAPDGSEPHDYSPSAKEVANLYDCRAFFVNGLGLENYTSSFNDQLKSKTYEVNEGVDLITLEGTTDPHVWLDPENAIIEMENIKNILSSIDEANKSSYEANFESAKKEFEELDEELSSIADETKNKNIVTSHAAFSYLCRAYGFNQIHLNGLSPDEEPSARGIETIIEAMNDYGISTIFYEENVSSEIAEKIADQTGAKTAVLNPLETLTQSMKEQNKDYIAVMKDNLNAIKEAGNNQ